MKDYRDHEFVGERADRLERERLALTLKDKGIDPITITSIVERLRQRQLQAFLNTGHAGQPPRVREF